MLKLNEGEYVGALYNDAEDLIVESFPVIRSTPDAALRDAKGLVDAYNGDLSDDERMADESWCVVTYRHGVLHDFPIVNLAPIEIPQLAASS